MLDGEPKLFGLFRVYVSKDGGDGGLDLSGNLPRLSLPGCELLGM
jgi:hypothetical protein